jgi:alpha-tubulin suppressor-like RCC1 family protein
MARIPLSAVLDLARRAILALALGAWIPAQAQVAVPVFNTGVDANGALLAGGSVDPHYTLLSSADPAYPGPNAIVASTIAEGYWMPNGPGSKWIAPQADQAYPPGVCNTSGGYTYRTTFDLTGFVPSTVVITGGWAADNGGQMILINGAVVDGVGATGYTGLTSFTIPSGPLVAGVNTLDFFVSDFGCPSGVRVELSGTGMPVASGPVLTFTPPSLAFGPVAVGSTGPGQQITLANTGTATATNLLPIALAGMGTPEFVVTSTTCAATLAAGASCTITLAFRPSATGQRYSAVAPASLAVTAPLAGAGTAPGAQPSSIVALSGGHQHTCALTSAGGAKCWGFGAEGQLGDGTGLRRLTPVDVSGLESHVAAVSSGSGNTCALTTAGGAACWGSNVEGMLGDGSLTQRLLPTEVVGGTGLASIAAGYLHTCAVTMGGAVRCWGNNSSYHQLGNPSPDRQLTPVAVTGLDSGWATVMAGAWHSCALSITGRVKCWGGNQSGELGNGLAETSNPVPQEVIGLGGVAVTALATGHSHTCALNANGGVLCWGQNLFGQLGDGTGVNRLAPVEVSGLQSGVVAIAAESFHTCALLATGAVRCWGANDEGQLGDGTRDDSLVPVDPGISGAVAIGTGERHSCAAVADGVLCWGLNTHGQLGDGTQVTRLVPTPVSFPVPDTTPDAFAFPSRTGVVLFGPQTSDPVTPVGYTSPAPISVANGTYSIDCGFSYTYTSAPGTINPGQSVCVQHNAAATNGTSVTTTLTIGGVSGTFTTTTMGAAILSLSPASVDFGPVPVGTTSAPRVVTLTNTGDAGATFLASTSGDFSIASQTCGGTIAPGASCSFSIVFTPSQAGSRSSALGVLSGASQTVSLAGVGTLAQQAITFGVLPHRGIGVTHTARAFASSGLPVTFSTLSPAVCTVSQATITPIAAGTCSIRADQAGNAAYEPAAPVTRAFAVTAMSNPLDSVALDVGWGHACVVTTEGAVKCWGYNLSGQLGIGETPEPRDMPVDVPSLRSGVAAVSSGDHSTCALTTGGGLKCWGDNLLGQLGDGTNVDRPDPVDVVGLASGVAAVSVGSTHACALTSAGGMKCWGWNGNGALGDGTLVDRNVPVDVVGLASGVAAISAGNGRTCAVTTAGAVKCWGNDLTSPADVPGLASGMAGVSVGSTHACALSSAGGVKCWGQNVNGELGDGTTVARETPVDVVGLQGGAVAIAAYSRMSCALGATGTVQCWGSDGNNSNRLTPAPMPGLLDNAVAVSVGNYFACALDVDGGVRCWGRNNLGQGGNGSTDFLPNPTFVAGLDGIDAVPAAFGGVTRTGVRIGSTQSFQATITGLYDPAQVSVQGGELSIGCTGTFTSSSGVLDPGVDVCVRHVAGATYSQSVATTLTIGGVSGTFTSITASPPQPSLSTTSLAFGNQPVGTASLGKGVVVTNPDAVHELVGLGAGVTGDFAVTGTTCTTTLAPGASCTFFVVFKPEAVGGRADELLVYSANGNPPLLRVLLTGAGTNSDTTPSTFSFVDQYLVPVNTVITSAPVHMVTISTFAAVTVIGGSYAISSGNNCSGDIAPFRTGPGAVQNNQYICVRHTSSPIPGGSNDTQLIVGGIGDTFTTITADPVPAQFALAPQAGVGLSSTRVSAAIAITGINTGSPFTVANGQVSVNCTGIFVSSGTLDPGSTLCARHVAGPGYNQAVTTTVTVGGVSADFVSTTFEEHGDADGDGIPNGLEYAETRDPEAKDNDVFGNARLFAMQQYRDFLAREGDAGGIEFWAGQVAGGALTRGQAIELFFGSPEFQGVIAPAARLYFAYFLRIPDYAGLNFWIGHYRAGNSLESISDFFAASAEFQATYGALDNAAFVNLVYRNVLGRAPDPGGFAFWRGQLDAGSMTRGQVMLGFSESDEYREASESMVYVTMMYFGMLRRAPEPQGFDFWVGYRDAGNPGLALIDLFLGSPEYRGRFLP